MTKPRRLTNRPHPTTPAIRTAKRGSSKPARSIVRDLRVIDEDPWARFSAPKDQAPWYYRSLVTVYRGNPQHAPALIDELDRTVAEMETLARRKPP